MGLCLVVVKASGSWLLLHHCGPVCCHNNWLLIARRHDIYLWTPSFASKGDLRIPSLWPGLPARHWLLFHVWFGSLHTCLLSLQLCSTVGTLWMVAHQAPPFIRFSRQEYWSGLPFPSPGDLPDPGIEPTSPVFPALAGRFFTTAPPGKPD